METWTEEEALMSTPYRDREAWAHILMMGLVLEKSRFRGPSGLLAEMQNLLLSTKVQEMAIQLLTQTTLTGETKAS